eukprot:1738943-Prymnesium_polylepis.3
MLGNKHANGNSSTGTLMRLSVESISSYKLGYVMSYVVPIWVSTCTNDTRIRALTPRRPSRSRQRAVCDATSASAAAAALLAAASAAAAA